VLGPKGGTGKTLTTVNLAAALAAAGQSVVVVDLDLQFGDIGLALGLAPDRTLYDLARAGGSLDAGKIEDFLTEHSTGIRAVLAPRRPDHAGAVTVEFVRELFDALREMSDFVIVDTPPGFTPEVIAAIDRSSWVCMVAMLDALSLKNTKLGLETLDLMGYEQDRVKVVLNRADSRVGITVDDVTKLLGRAPDLRVPSHRDITRSVNEALPIVTTSGNAEARRAFESLAASYMDAHAAQAAPAPSAKQPRRRIIGRRRKAN
jgi:pilus assembly protein CpaE